MQTNAINDTAGPSSNRSIRQSFERIPVLLRAQAAMVALAGGAILYDTSNVLHHYPEDRYVGAALQLFASVALMFWYVLRLFMSSRD